jgi:hypothetical protein
LNNPADSETLDRLIEQNRNSLGDLGWFIKCLDEPIARQANKENGCTGNFWEIQALLNEKDFSHVWLTPI